MQLKTPHAATLLLLVTAFSKAAQGPITWIPKYPYPSMSFGSQSPSSTLTTSQQIYYPTAWAQDKDTYINADNPSQEMLVDSTELSIHAAITGGDVLSEIPYSGWENGKLTCTWTARGPELSQVGIDVVRYDTFTIKDTTTKPGIGENVTMNDGTNTITCTVVWRKRPAVAVPIPQPGGGG